MMKSGKDDAAMEATKKPIYVHCSNHFDSIWRRGFRKSFEYKGERYVSDSELQLACIDEWLEMAVASDDLKFEVECSLVLRHYLEQRPEKLETFRRLFAEGRFELLAAGEIIPDPNMPSGETLVRNLVYGMLWAENTLGELPVSGCVNDGFGASAQMPQLFRGCGIKWLTGLCYKFPAKDYWRGLDGSMLYINQDFRTKNMKYLSRPAYYRPCPDCGGDGCQTCLDRGFDHSYRMGMEGEVDASRLDMEHYPLGWIEVGGEENLVVQDLPERVRHANASSDSDGRYRYEFILLKELAERFREDIEAVDNPDPERISAEIDGNPVSSGCLVSRIKTKQRLREAEGKLEAVEKWAALAKLNGSADYPMEHLTEAWRLSAFTAFHDSVTGTHVDVGYEELMETFDEIGHRLELAEKELAEAGLPQADGRIAVFNPHSYQVTQPVSVLLAAGTVGGSGRFRIIDEAGLEAELFETLLQEEVIRVSFLVRELAGLSWAQYTVEALPEAVVGEIQASEAGAPGFEAEAADPIAAKVAATYAPSIVDISQLDNLSIENEYFRVRTNEHGITSIWDKLSGQELVNPVKGYANELVLEHDVGDPWTTRELHRPRHRLGNSTRLTGIQRFANHSVITYHGKLAGNEDVTNPIDYRVLVLEWKQRVIVRDGVRRVDFETEIDWDSFDRRIRVSFPTPVASKHDHGHYAIPYGTLTRERYEMSFTGWENANGDWPALEWVSTALQRGINVAIFNKGTPSSRIERGEILMSLLRSPTFPNCLLWPKEYNAPVYDGMRDAGLHNFTYSLYSYEGDWQDSEVVREAYSFNKPLLAYRDRLIPQPAGIRLDGAGTLVSAMKKAEREEAVIVRLFQYSGRKEQVVLQLPSQVKGVYDTNLLEREEKELLLSEERRLELSMKPFQIRTLLLRL